MKGKWKCWDCLALVQTSPKTKQQSYWWLSVCFVGKVVWCWNAANGYNLQYYIRTTPSIGQTSCFCCRGCVLRAVLQDILQFSFFLRSLSSHFKKENKPSKRQNKTVVHVEKKNASIRGDLLNVVSHADSQKKKIWGHQHFLNKSGLQRLQNHHNIWLQFHTHSSM